MLIFMMPPGLSATGFRKKNGQDFRDEPVQTAGLYPDTGPICWIRIQHPFAERQIDSRKLRNGAAECQRLFVRSHLLTCQGRDNDYVLSQMTTIQNDNPAGLRKIKENVSI
jgi:hypothetical protein